MHAWLLLRPTAVRYLQGLFEGMKAYRRPDRAGYTLFRPEENARRMQRGAERMCMPAPSVEQFVHAVRQTVLANRRWVRAYVPLFARPAPATRRRRPAITCVPCVPFAGAAAGEGSPVPPASARGERPDPWAGSGPRVHLPHLRRTRWELLQGQLVSTATPVPFLLNRERDATLIFFFQEGLAPINLVVHDEFHRAMPGGTGGVKTIANYAPVRPVRPSGTNLYYRPTTRSDGAAL